MDRRLLWLAVGAFATSTMAFVFAGLLPLGAADTHVPISPAARLVVGGTTFAVALGAPLGSLIGNVAGWRATFLFVGLLAVLCATVLTLMLPRGLPGVKLTLAERMLTITRPKILPSLVVTFLYLTG